MVRHFTLKKMKGFSLSAILVMAVMMISIIAKAQYPVSSYSFTQTSGTYTPITGGTLIVSPIPDYASYPSITLTPGFNFCGTVYTNAFVTADGLITLGGASAVNVTGAIGYTGAGVLLCPFNSDMIGSSAAGASSNIRYELVGNEHVFQWNDISRYPSSTDRFSFQARLNYVTGTITYVYSVTSVGTSTSYQPVIGIRTANTAGNWQSRMVANDATSSWAASVPGTVTGDVCRFTSNATNPKQPTTGQTYIYTPPPACNTVATLPTAGSVSATPGTLCLSGNVTLSFTPATTMPSVTGITYKWQTSPTLAGTYTDIPGAITTTPTYTTTVPVSASAYFKCVVLCNGTTTVLTSSASNQVVINNPGTPTVNGATRCGPGSVTLTATPPTGSTVNWYANATGGAPLFNGNSFNTGYIPATTTFYAAAASGSSPAMPQIGTGTGSQADYETGGPFNNYYRAEQTQMLYTAAEIIAAGGGGGTINSIAFNCTGIPMQGSSATTLPNYKVFIKTVPSSTTTLSWQAAASFTQVYTTTAFNPVLGWNTFNLSTPFTWDGVDNIVIRICYDQTTPSYSSGTTQGKHQFSVVTGRMMYFNSDGVASGCDQTGTSTSTSLPNVRLGMTLGCTGNRLPVVATVTTPPAVTKTAVPIACNNAITTISVASSPMSNYTTYSWTPVVTDLYTNAAATTPYISGNAPTVYMKSSTVGPHTYYMYATGATPAACAFADTVQIWVQPDSVYIKAAPDTICVSGTSMLKLMPQTGYAPNTIQWQDSPNGATYTDIAGATGVIYTTPTLTANRFYRALIKSAGTTPCQSPVKKIVVANPLLISKTDSFNCGPGTVTLQATVGANSGIKWYESMTASQPVGGGSPWVTPYLGVTDTFYVAASSGTPQPDPANVVVAGSTGTMASASLPLYYNKGHRFQWMITAAEMTAQGYTEGLVKSIGFDFAGVNMTYQNISLKMKLTAATSFAVAGLPGTTFTTGMDQVYTAASFTPVPNSINSFMLQAPFYWDGTSNIIIEMCHNNAVAGTFANSANLKYRYNYTYPNNQAIYQYGNVDNICSTPTGGTAFGPYSSYYRPHTIIGMVGACESPRQAVIAYIRPVPVVDLGPDINKCVDAGYAEVLDAGVQPNTPQFLWDNGSVSQVRAVNESGTYNVKVTNQYGCHDEDTVTVILRANPVVELGNDTTVCNGVVLNLNPGNGGIEYFWNTGQTSQSININTPGTYSVFVTNSVGCTKADTIVVNMQGELPTIQGINVTNNGQYTFHFTAVNPQNVIGYDWDFGDGSAHSYQASPIHTYPDAGNYIVVLHLSSTCGFLSDSSSAHILGINQLNVTTDELTVYPNPAKAVATILNRGALKMEQIEVYNILGQVIYKSKADSKDKHTLNLDGFASGVYTIQVYTDKGTVARKLEIIR
jgi:hypothetical protein